MDQKWKILSGEKNWEGLLDPLDLDLRKYLIHYGEMARVTVDCFNSEKASKYAGSCLFGKAELFDKAGINKGKPSKYQVTKYIYATSSSQLPEAFVIKSLSREAWSKESNWMGYVAVATEEGKQALGRRDILVAWRGTVESREWINDLQFELVPAPEIFGEVKLLQLTPLVHLGFQSIYISDDPKSPFNTTSARDQVLTEVRRLVELYKDEEISITVVGHSLGAAVATLNAADIAFNQYNKPVGMPDKACPVTAFVYASPKVGDLIFHNTVSKLSDLQVMRIKNQSDIVPDLPPNPVIIYCEVGKEVLIDTNQSSYLKRGNWHNLEIYLHGIAGVQKNMLEFTMEVSRDIALLNKDIDGLKDEYCIPVSWWIQKNKGMVQQEDGVRNSVNQDLPPSAFQVMPNE